MTENNIQELLLKKWELLWNHYRIQDEMMEKRRNLIWIIQSLLLAAWYYCIYLKSVEPIYLNNNYFKALSIVIPSFGILINLILLVVLSRHYISILIDEIALRDVEIQLNSINGSLNFNRFTIDKEILYHGNNHKWEFSKEKIGNNKLIRYSSQRWWLNKFIPFIFIFIWSLILFVFCEDILMSILIIALICFLLILINYTEHEIATGTSLNHH